MGKKITGYFLLFLLLGLAAFAGWRYWETLQKDAEGGGSHRAKPVVVNITTVKRQTMRDERVFSGTTAAWSSYDIEPKVSGRLLELRYDIGDIVKRGERIARIDDEEYRQELRESEANLAYARAKLKEAQGVAELKEKEFIRQQRLKENQATSDSSYETAKSAHQAQLATAEMCAAEVRRCEAALANAKIRLNDTLIAAAWNSGSDVRHVGARYVDEGSLLTMGKPILNIVELDRIKANVQIIERDYRFLRVGQAAEVTADAYPDEVFTGTIANIGNVLSDKTRNALTVIAIPNADYRLRPGMFVRVRILLSEHKNAQTVPVNAVLTKYGEVGVFCYDTAKEEAVFVPVTTGLTTREVVEIVRPELNQPIVTIGNHLLDTGKKVIVSELSRSELVQSKYSGTQAAAPEKTEPVK